MSAIVPFNFEHQPVRVTDRQGQPWFALADVCAVLGLSNVSDAAARLDDDEKDDLALTDTIGRSQATIIINESGMWKLVLRSRKPAAARLTKWLTSEVLPSIRRTGSYGTPAPSLDLSDPAVLQRLLLDHTSNAMAAEARVAELEPQAEALKRIADTSGLMCVTDAAKTLGVPPRRLQAWMEAHHWAYRRRDTGRLVACQPKLDSLMLDHKSVEIPGNKTVQQLMVTPKGLARLATLKAGA